MLICKPVYLLNQLNQTKLVFSKRHYGLTWKHQMDINYYDGWMSNGGKKKYKTHSNRGSEERTPQSYNQDPVRKMASSHHWPHLKWH